MGATTDLHIAQPITLKSGLTLPNRLVKAAMAEELAGSDLLPNETLSTLYSRWSEGGWGLVLTGNIQVDHMHLGSSNGLAIDETLPAATTLEAYKAYAMAAKGGLDGTTPVIVQLNHPGRQAPSFAGRRSFFSKAIAPSALPMDLGPGILARVLNRLVFGTPREMTTADIEAVKAQFVRGARVAADAGFDGVEIHAAHGYLLAQFLSAEGNVRTDKYGGTPENRARIVAEIVEAIKSEVKGKDGFTVGVKLNSVDHQSVDDLRDCIKQLKVITDAGVDFLEISGGSYEDPQMAVGPADYEKKQRSARTEAREAFFLEFASSIRSEFPGVPLIVTGGFRSRKGMEAAVAAGDCDMIGIGRPAVINPLLPQAIVFNPELKDQDATLYVKKLEAPWIIKFLDVKAIGAGVETMWYSGQMKEMTKPSTKEI
ncbi:NADH:flavin oxidoreductase/NADH oxidase [Lasiosphaeria hispida]|uniref:NADH:flavin oxidoreductase/NADH oxidase n=1 Tax=Lasiosphaeria hispida TaxID=260671 RepID=A0AAJ0HQ78_9PEZI|nr:NADH:flavin oxidoreductase/NADH oxidase [Lasiosphaeria hispida]